MISNGRLLRAGVGHTVSYVRFAVAIAILLFSLSFRVDAALGVEPTLPDDMATQLRRSIFVDAAYVRQRRGESCSSLDGPNCLAALRPNEIAAPFRGVEVGIVPEVLLKRLGSTEVDKHAFHTPGYMNLEMIRRQIDDAAAKTSGGQLPYVNSAFSDAKHTESRGVILFDGLTPESRVPLTYSLGLPRDIIATWDGRWIAEDCSLTTHTEELPSASSSSHAGPLDDELGVSSANRVGVQIGGSISYLRFSKPVIVRSIKARWTNPPASASTALVAGRFGLKDEWDTFLDPKQLRNSSQWVEIGGNPLAKVDELAFIATAGLEVSTIDVAAALEAEGDSNRTILMMSPIPVVEDRTFAKDEGAANLMLKDEQISASAMPLVLSLQEVVDKHLRIVLEDEMPRFTRGVLLPHTLHLAAELAAQGDQGGAEFLQRVAMSHNLVDPRTLTALLAGSFAALPAKEEAKDGAFGQEMFEAVLSSLAEDARTHDLPADLRKALTRERSDIAEALQLYSGTANALAGRVPVSSESVHSGLALAKRYRTKIDLLAGIFLHLGSTSR
eukprot:TRINITY_DN46411_c0_g1_i1.p1 TRINITY_DN46411_c0_g1~~TRINITY_DN46411_c0_g1_i1.p1  ORF type:complete len:557 (+),score=97.56 TRINITY_DN46411_c0_g1_i1:64-1734(+)